MCNFVWRICSSLKFVIFKFNIGFSPARHQTTIQNNEDQGFFNQEDDWNIFKDVLGRAKKYLFKKMNLKMSTTRKLPYIYDVPA